MLPRLRAWMQDLQAGEAANSYVKVFILGNGRVGKTQICRQLRGETYDDRISSTHGIEVDQNSIELAPAANDQPAVRAQLWDFGGQDIYLGTHALFLDERAVFVIAWNPEYENFDEIEDNGNVMRNRSLQYWVDYVRSLAGPEIAIIVTQTQCEKTLDERAAPLADARGITRTMCSAKDAGGVVGMDELHLALKKAAYRLLEQYGKVRLPEKWLTVGASVKALKADKTMARAVFDEICEQQQCAAPQALLEYLCRSGQVFYRQGAFDDHVVTDLAFALRGVYAVFDRAVVRPALVNAGGKINASLLAGLAWRSDSDEVRSLFLSMMQQCAICFEIADGVHLIPELMPTAVPDAARQIWQVQEAELVACLDYDFLHEGVPRAMLCEIGRRAGPHASYWKYGVCFYDERHHATVRICTVLPEIECGKQNGRITVEVAARSQGSDARELARHLIASIEQLTIGRAPRLTWEKGGERIEERDRVEAPRESDSPFALIQPAQHIVMHFHGNAIFEDGALTQENAMGDKIKIGDKNVIGAVGTNAQTNHSTLNQTWNSAVETIDLGALAGELALLRKAMRTEAAQTDNAAHDKAVADIGAAEIAAGQQNREQTFGNLKSAGKWAWEMASKIGAALAAKAIEAALGMH